jgi:hypothetical protein
MTNATKRNVFQQEPVWQIQIYRDDMEMVETRLEITTRSDRHHQGSLKTQRSMTLLSTERSNHRASEPKERNPSR